MTAQHASRGSLARRALRAATALAATAALTGLVGGAAAASGGVLVTEGSLDVTAQRAVVSWVDGQQRMLLDMDVAGRVEPGATALMLVATPTPPTIAVADSAVMDAFVSAGGPEVVEEEHWWPDLQSFRGGTGEPTWDRAEVELPTAEAGTAEHGAVPAEQLIGWYTSNGFEVDEATAEAIARFAAAGWAFTEVQFDPGEEIVEGATPVVDLTFATGEAVVPMVLAASGAVPLQSSTYVLGAERLDRTSMPTSAEVGFSGPVSAAAYPELTDWLAPFGESATLTVVHQQIQDPSRITEDVRFQPSIFGPVPAGTEVRRVERIILGIPAGLMLVAGGMLAVAVGGVTVSRLMQRGYRD